MQERAEFLGDDLLVGRPWRLVVDLRVPALARGDVRGDEQRLVAGEEHAADDRLERSGCVAGAGEVRDPRGRGVGLLGADPAVLDGEVRGVTSGEHPSVEAAHPASVVDRHQAVRLGSGDPAQAGPRQPRQRHHALRMHLSAVRLHRDVARADDVCGCAGVQRDGGLLEQPLHRFGRAAAERLQRPLVGRDERDLARGVHAEGALGGHERELVERQRPRRPVGLDEHEAGDVTALDVLHDPVERLAGVAIVEHVGVFVRCRLPAAEGDQHGVVRELVSAGEMHRVLGGIDRVDAVLDPPRSEHRHDRAQRVAARAAERERLAHGKRPVHEAVARIDQRDLDLVAGEAP